MKHYLVWFPYSQTIVGVTTIKPRAERLAQLINLERSGDCPNAEVVESLDLDNPDETESDDDW